MSLSRHLPYPHYRLLVLLHRHQHHRCHHHHLLRHQQRPVISLGLSSWLAWTIVLGLQLAPIHPFRKSISWKLNLSSQALLSSLCLLSNPEVLNSLSSEPDNINPRGRVGWWFHYIPVSARWSAPPDGLISRYRLINWEIKQLISSLLGSFRIVPPTSDWMIKIEIFVFKPRLVS